MKKILVVDDDASIRRVLSQMLEANGYSVVTAATREDAVGVLKNQQDFALFILDFWVGTDTGLEVMADLQQVQPAVPVLFLSGGNEEVALETSTALAEMRGASEFLYKPIQAASLLNAVGRYI